MADTIVLPQPPQIDDTALNAVPQYLQDMVTRAVNQNWLDGDLGTAVDIKQRQETNEFVERFNEQARELQRSKTDFFNQTLDENVAINEATKEIEELQKERGELYQNQEAFLSSKKFLVENGIVDENDQFLVNQEQLVDRLLGEEATQKNMETYTQNLQTFGENVRNQDELTQYITALQHSLERLSDFKDENGQIKEEIKELVQSGTTLVSTANANESLEDEIAAYTRRTKEDLEKLQAEQKKFQDAEAYLKENVKDGNEGLVGNLLDYQKSQMKSTDFQKDMEKIDAGIETQQEIVHSNQQKINTLAERIVSPKEDALNDALAAFENTKQHYAQSGQDKSLNSLQTYISSRLSQSEGGEQNNMSAEFAEVAAENASRAGGAGGLLTALRSNSALRSIAPEEIDKKDAGLQDGERTAGDRVTLKFRKEGNDVIVEMQAAKHGYHDADNKLHRGRVNHEFRVVDGVSNGVDLSQFKNDRLEIIPDNSMDGANVALLGLNDNNPAQFTGKGYAYEQKYMAKGERIPGKRIERADLGFTSVGIVDTSKDNLANPETAFDVVGADKNNHLLALAGKSAEMRENALFNYQERQQLTSLKIHAQKNERDETINAGLREELGIGAPPESNQTAPAKSSGGFNLATAEEAAKNGLIPKNSAQASDTNANALAYRAASIAPSGLGGQAQSQGYGTPG